MLWHEITVLALEPSQEMVSHFMHEFGAAGVSIEESWTPDKPRDTSLGQWYDKPLNNIRPGYAEIKGYYAEETDIEAVVAQLKQALAALPEYGYDAGDFSFSVSQVKDEDWESAWKQYFKPLQITERLTIKPTWEEYAPREGEVIIELDPGMAFGTGTHPTTALCLQVLDGAVREGDAVIDVGTGSGILAIGAVKLGASRVLALDLDPVAVSSATENVKLNGLQDVIEVRRSDLLGVLREPDASGLVQPPVDLVVANILAEIILRFVDDVMEVLKPGGIYIASGIYINKEADVEAALLQAGFQIIDRVRQEDWVAIVAGKPKEDEEGA